MGSLFEESKPAQQNKQNQAYPLPSGWVWTTLGEIAGINPRDSFLHDLPDETEVSFVPMAAVDARKGTITQPMIRTLGEVRKGYTPFREGDVLFAKITPSMENGKAAIALQLRNGLGFGSTEFHVLRPRREAVLSEWIFYFVRQEKFRQEAKANFAGTAGQLRVPAKFLIAYPLPLAPLPEQRRIVAKIEELFSQLDAAEEGLQRVRRNLKRYRATVLKAAVEGRLVLTEAELARREGRTYETGEQLLRRILAERRRKWEEQEWAKLVEKAKKKAAQASRKARGLPARMKDIPPEEWQSIPEAEYRRYLPKDDRWGQKYKEPTPPDTTNLPPLPEGWTWATVGQLGGVSAGITKNRKRAHLPIQLPYLRVANVYANQLRLDDVARIGVEEQEIPKVLLKKGDLLVVEGNGSIEQIGRVAIWDGRIEPCLHQNHIIKVRFFLPEVVHYTLYWLLSQEGRAQIMRVASSTSGLYTLSLSKVEHLPVPLPPLAEQRRIVAEVERRLSVAREAEKAVEANLKRIARLRQAILKRAFEGKLVPQNPNDEPAEKLLEKIKISQRKQEVA